LSLKAIAEENKKNKMLVNNLVQKTNK
jgi:hypothetical protein